ncbi:MAG: RNA polymerase sigma factor [Lachnospiraceae bacterium]|nr:RNA polymerase sigma factor [Lachnospiraceae bacterium]
MNPKLSTQEFENTYHRYKQLLFRIAYSYTKNAEDAEDLVQEAFMKRLYKAPDFLTEEHEKRWMIRIIVNLSKNHVMSFWHRKRTAMKEISDQAIADLGETRKDLWQEVLALPDKYKISLYLHYYEGYTCKEIAEILDCKESAIKMRLKKGRELLKIELLEGEESYEIRGV